MIPANDTPNNNITSNNNTTPNIQKGTAMFYVSDTSFRRQIVADRQDYLRRVAGESRLRREANPKRRLRPPPG